MNEHIIQKSGPLVYNGVTIGAKSEMLSLTDMWKAAGADDSRRPYEWSRKEGSAFIEAVSISLDTPVERIYKSKRGGRGKGGETIAHWQIGLAYAKYLNPQFHMWCNEVVRAHMEGRAVATAHNLTDYDRQIIGNIVKNCTGVVIREQIEALLPVLIEPLVTARLSERDFMIRHGKTAKQIWDEHRLPPKLRGSTVWFGNRLKEMGAAIENDGRYDRGSQAIRLFDPDKAAIFLRNGLLHRAKVYASERMGQGKLRLIRKEVE